MAQPFSPPPHRPPPQPFSATPGALSPLFWQRLIAYRPLVLLGGLWVFLVCVSAIAYRGLMYNEPAEALPPAEAPLTVAAEPLPVAADPVVAVDEASSPGVALWGLASLVGLCAFGSFVLTQQIRASAQPRRQGSKPPQKSAQSMAPKPGQTLVQSPAPPRPSAPKRLAPYSPERDSVVVPGARPAIAPPAPQAQPGPSPQVPPAPAMPPAASASPAVVGEGEHLALDFPEGSVAHALDVRQRRSLSSFM